MVYFRHYQTSPAPFTIRAFFQPGTRLPHSRPSLPMSFPQKIRPCSNNRTNRRAVDEVVTVARTTNSENRDVDVAARALSPVTGCQTTNVTRTTTNRTKPEAVTAVDHSNRNRTTTAATAVTVAHRGTVETRLKNLTTTAVLTVAISSCSSSNITPP